MQRQTGFSLLEVLIASALLATALLALAALAARSIQDAAIGRDEAAAFVLLQDLEGRMALSGGGAWTPPAALTRPEWQSWTEQVNRRLPNATATLCHDATPDDGTPEDSACDGQGALTAKLYWRRFDAVGTQRRSRAFGP